jgi:hypothetical protein
MKKSMQILGVISVVIILLLSGLLILNHLSELNGIYDITVIEETFAAMQ